MTDELLAGASVVLLIATVVTVWFVRRERLANRLGLALCGLVAIATVSGFTSRERGVPESEVTGRPKEAQAAGYVSSATCRACHAHEYQTWHDSYHRSMTQRASPESVLADFDDVTLERKGKTFHLERLGDEFWIEMDDPMAAKESPASRVRRKVSMTTGSHNMQLCWYESGHSRVIGLLPFAFLLDDQRWIPRIAAFVLPPSDEIMPEFGQWSLVCLKCHATNSRPRLDMDRGGIHGADTEVSEFGIACEACHGPGAEHVAANRNPLRRYAMHLATEPDPTMVNPARLDHVRSTQVCGQCHGNFDFVLSGRPLQEWFAHGFKYRPGKDLESTRKATRAGWDEQFWSDGVPRVAGREYNALLDSACFERGEMACVSCHVLHQPTDDPRPRAEWANDQLRHAGDDENCLSCHESYAAEIPAHTHHLADSAGSRCYNCHMPHTAYGLLKGIRNHRVANPSVVNTLATGRPNACNQCHLDKSLGWTVDTLATWYGTAKPALSAEDRTYAAGVRWALEGDAAQRALVAWSLGWQPAQEASGREWIAPYLAELMGDPYEAVRVIAERSLRKTPGYEHMEFDLLGSDEMRAAAKTEVLEQWRATIAPAGDDHRAPVLIGPDGVLRAELFALLLSRRNNRLVSLLE